MEKWFFVPIKQDLQVATIPTGGKLLPQSKVLSVDLITLTPGSQPPQDLLIVVSLEGICLSSHYTDHLWHFSPKPSVHVPDSGHRRREGPMNHYTPETYRVPP